ncbi:hypothetical protein MROS_2667 [Melioribacter roseus P3M-2]|uniref:Exopolysaccharide biosynthesis protein YbjH n=1 Tax=Melioribacter roseus (strain DSM 23840 / JCM 17771 / VKM B-2668 / P3M-2) TaxID=1191523 RepID=I6YZC5_MELRP|nr:YjbH domain-containing protein [Melioribacter roseus]AFN75897.1 hypothetical protein MROS_2667 [Melioribacter roseus P3M-2]
MKKFIFPLALCLFNFPVLSQSLTGMNGLLSIPVPYIGEDAKVTSGVNFIDRKYTDYSQGKRDLLNIFVSINYLPFVELGVRATRQLNYQGNSHTVDRMFNIKIQLIEEDKYLPALSVGFNNPYSSVQSANHFNSTFIVVAKQIRTSLGQVSAVLGYGKDIIKAADYQFIGLFGGISYKPYDFVEFIVENDAERFNGALRIHFFKHIHLLAGMMNFKDFSGGISFSFAL